MQLSVAICEDYLEERSQLGRLVRIMPPSAV